MEGTINYAARTPVWSGLGTDISSCRSVDEALAKSGLDFTVHQTDICTDELDPIPLCGFKANIRDDGTPLGIVSTKYKVVQNQDAFGFLDGLMDEGMKFERAGGLYMDKTGHNSTVIMIQLPYYFFVQDAPQSCFFFRDGKEIEG